MTILKDILVDLRLDINLFLQFLGVFEAADLNFVIEVANVANDGLILHLQNMFKGDDIAVASCGDKNVAFLDSFFHRGDFKAFHSSLQSANRVDFCYQNAGAVTLHGMRATLSDFTITANDNDLTGNHHICSTLDAIGQRFAAAVQIIKLRLGDGIGGGILFGNFSDMCQADRVNPNDPAKAALENVGAGAMLFDQIWLGSYMSGGVGFTQYATAAYTDNILDDFSHRHS